MNEAMWAVLSKWDMINIKVKALMSSGQRGMSGELDSCINNLDLAWEICFWSCLASLGNGGILECLG